MHASRSKLLASAACAATLLTLGGCASVIETPASEMAAVQTVVPIAKPGTETAAYAMPAATTGDGEAAPVSALAGEKSASAAEAATEKMAASPEQPQLPTNGMEAAFMEPGFDSGEPVGLEQLVASRKIVPVTKPAYRQAALTAPQTPIPAGQSSQSFQKSGTPIDALITKYAAIYEIPEALLHRVVKRESRYNPRAYNRGHYGLMQIKYATAKSMGYDGPAEGLFDAETNIKYAAKYLRGAWLVADDKNDGAVQLYAAGYYYHAKRKGLLEETGLR